MKNINVLKAKLSFAFITAAMFLLLIGIVSATSYKVLAAEVITSESKASTINVSGDGEVSVAPDIAYVSFGVLTENASVGEAQKYNSSTMNNIIDNLKKAGVASEDIKTSGYSISPKYNYDNKTGNSTIAGFIVTNNLNVTVKDINSVGSIIDTAILNGANNSNGVTFGVSDYEKYYNIALKNAISNAKAKAETIASCIDLKLSIPTKITENSSGVPSEYPVSYNSPTKVISGDEGMNVEVGTCKIKANVSLVYEY